MTGAELAVRTAVAAPDIREAGARAVIREARQQGHDYVELRWAGRRVVFFCTLCLTQCFGDSSLWSHLRGAPHARRHAAAMRTLLSGPIPWPFSDGILFFNTVTRSESNPKPKPDLVIPVGDKRFSLTLRISGIGHVAASVSVEEDKMEEEEEVGSAARCRIWCAWIGEGGSDDVPVLSTAPDCEFAVVNFKFNCELGRRTNTAEELSLYVEGGGSPRKRSRQSFSDPEAEVEENEEESSGGCGGGEESSSSTREGAGWDGTRVLSGRALRRQMRKRERLAADRSCDICRQRMLPGKDVATLLNLKTRRLACSSRNTTGAFHVFHISCLIHWILLCEFEIWSNNKPAKKRGGRGRKSKRPSKGHISSVFCPECEGTGANVQEDLENPTVHLSEMFLYKLKTIQGHRAWMEDPETLKKCSTGLNISCNEQLKEKDLPSKLLHVYQADI